jgi:cysteinyl-tRNA synthetase
MSKSIGNVLLVHDLIKTIPGEVIRLALLNAHYRQPLDWSGETIESAKRMLDRLYGAIRGIDVSADARSTAEPPAAVIAALEDDLNTPKAMAEIFDLARTLNKTTDTGERSRIATSLLAAGDLVGLLQDDPEDWFTSSIDSKLSDSEIESLLKEREEARSVGDYERADVIRDDLADKGVSIEDGPDGTRWRLT